MKRTSQKDLRVNNFFSNAQNIIGKTRKTKKNLFFRQRVVCILINCSTMPQSRNFGQSS